MKNKFLVLLLLGFMFLSCSFLFNNPQTENNNSASNSNSNSNDTLPPSSSNGNGTTDEFLPSVQDGEVLFVTTGEYLVGKTDLKDGVLSVDIPESDKELYLVISNTTGKEIQAPAISGYDIPPDTTVLSSRSTFVSDGDESVNFTDAFIYEKTNLIKKNDAVARSTTKVPSYSSYAVLNEGEQKYFYEYERKKYYTATLRKKVTADTDYGLKKLYIFVEDAMWGINGAKINQEFIDSQADAFLKEGKDNDIYDYVTSIFSEEWGPHDYANLIDDKDEIVIVFSQFGTDTNVNSGVVGYYWNAHNFKSSYYSRSAESILLNMNAYITFNHQKMSLTTMAHEFQHAIHYYNRTIKNEDESATWVNEMFSALAEDAVADFLGVQGPGNNNIITGGAGSKISDLLNGRIAEYIRGSRYDFTRWKDSSAFGTDTFRQVYPYGLVYSLGTYLVRNFGTDFIKEYMNSTEIAVLIPSDDSKVYDQSSLDNSSREMLVNSINKANGTNISWADIMKGWGCSVLLSDGNAPKGVSNTIVNEDESYWFTKPYQNQKYSLRIPSVMYNSYIVPFSSPATMWDNGSSLSTKGPFVFNQSADRMYSNAENLVLRGNTNTFVLLSNSTVKGQKQYKIQEVEGLTYSLVLK